MPYMPLTSVIIPALNEVGRIARCLDSVCMQAGDVESIVVDGGSTDGTTDLIPDKVRVLRGTRGRARQMNMGATHATGDVFLFLHADSALPPGAIEAIHRALANTSIVGGTFRLQFDRDSPLLNAYAWCTRFRWRMFHYGDQGIFIRRDAFRSLGGFADIPIMEDVDLLARMPSHGCVSVLPLRVTTSARRFEHFGIVRQQLLNTLMVGLYSAGVSPTRLASWYDNVHR